MAETKPDKMSDAVRQFRWTTPAGEALHFGEPMLLAMAAVSTVFPGAKAIFAREFAKSSQWVQVWDIKREKQGDG
jgi:hypothetical protein